MDQEFKLTREEEAALDQIDSEMKASTTRATARKEAAALDVGDLCEKYKAIKGSLKILVKILRKFGGKFGERAADAIEFLMGLADVACPA